MSDLISRSQLLKEMETWGGCVDALHDYIQNMPTAYDVDKVVEELEKESFTTTDTVCGGIFKAIRLSSAIEIVKQCGVSDDLCEWNGYKVAEEQDLMFRLPCGIGDDVYFIPSKTNYKLNILQGHPEINRVYHQNVERITYTPTGWYLECDKDLEYATDNILVDKLYKETWFLTQEEAEQKLKEMESD